MDEKASQTAAVHAFFCYSTEKWHQARYHWRLCRQSPRPRATTHDIDIQIDVTDVTELRGRLVQLLMADDSRFSVENHKLFFNPLDAPGIKVPIEALRLGDIGLPRQLKIHYNDSGTSGFEPSLVQFSDAFM
jgi:hypothetical protein